MATASFDRDVILAAIDRAEKAAVANQKAAHAERVKEYREKRTETTKLAMQQYREWIKVLQQAVKDRKPLASRDDIPAHPAHGKRDYYYSRDSLIYFGKAEPKKPSERVSSFETTKNVLAAMEPGSRISLNQLERSLGLSRSGVLSLAQHIKPVQS